MTGKPNGLRINRADLIAGILVISLALGFVFLAYGYGMGSHRRMGAGYFPFALGVLGAVLGLVIVFQALRTPELTQTVIQWRRLIFIGASFVVFGLGIEPLGLLLTIIATTCTASLADGDARLRESLLLGVGLALAIWIIFIGLLGSSVPILPRGL